MIPEIENQLNTQTQEVKDAASYVTTSKNVKKNVSVNAPDTRIIQDVAGNRKQLTEELNKLAKKQGAELVEESIEFDKFGGIHYEFEKELDNCDGMSVYHYHQNAMGNVELIKKIIIEYTNSTGLVNHYCYTADGLITRTQITADGKKEIDYFVSEDKKHELERERSEVQGTLNILNAMMASSGSEMKRLFEAKQKKIETKLNTYNNIFSKLNDKNSLKYADLAE